MVSRITQRKQAYQFILDKNKKLEAQFSYNTTGFTAGNNIIPLSELDKLRRGIADPTEELVAVLQNLLSPVASEAEIQDKLVKPFSKEPR